MRAGNLHITHNGSISLPNYINAQSQQYRYEYSLKDHLGNLRVSCRCGDPVRKANGDIVKNNQSREPIQIVQQNDYDAWGLDFGTNQTPPLGAGGADRYQYNSKERIQDLGIELYDYGARHYDAAVGRWSVVDPLSEDAPSWTSYRAVFNNPLRFIDPNGLFEIETGKIEKGDNLTSIAEQLNKKFKTNLTVEQIAKANNIKDINKIKAGELIVLPGTNVELNFDLSSLKVTDVTYEIDMPDFEWEGTSGREGNQNKESQELENKGPIPEGQYIVDPSRTQSISEISTADRVKGLVGRGPWPGLENSWGEHRTWLKPTEETNTYKRSGFTIHGGRVPGSAGCIDLTSRNNNFHSWLKSRSKPLILNVKY